jgi:hypothetical protein
MTCAELTRVFVDRAMARAAHELSPIEYVSRLKAQLCFLEERAAVSGDGLEAELLKLAHEFNLLSPEVSKCR